MIGRDEKNGPQGSGISEDVSFTLNTADRHAVAYSFYPQMKAECITFTEEVGGCLINGTNAGYQNGVMQGYIIRRLTPTECARLQGFPDWWCSDLGTDDPTIEDIMRWRTVFDTYSNINGTKSKSDNQICKWLKDPHTDSAEYKMWGNGVALPCVYFVLSGIVWAENNPNESIVDG